jgi:hypothetical protein
MNFRRTRNKLHAFAMTHHASIADRIGRSYSPRGGREERELKIWSIFNDHADLQIHTSKRRTRT